PFPSKTETLPEALAVMTSGRESGVNKPTPTATGWGGGRKSAEAPKGPGPSPSNTLTLWGKKVGVTRSGLLSPLKLATATALGRPKVWTGNVAAGPKVPSPFPGNTLTLSLSALAVTTSTFVSPVSSPATIATGWAPVGKVPTGTKAGTARSSRPST